MREKHCELSIFLFMVTTILVFGFFMLTTTQAFADNGYKGRNDKHKEWQKQKEQEKEYRKHREEMEREHRKHYKEQRRRDYKKHSDYRMHRGYRERPYDQHRHYGHHDYKGHRYDYQGHWRSWEQWDRYARKHPHIYKHGRYYREGGHLMFRFRDPGTGNSFFFSIGR
jgi:hypothetical protein